MQSAQKLIAKEQTSAGLSLEEHCHRMHIFYGHPQEIVAGLAADRLLPHTQDLILQFSPIIPPFAEAVHMLEQIATEIAPALGWQPQP
jgi:hypothetical protein